MRSYGSGSMGSAQRSPTPASPPSPPPHAPPTQRRVGARLLWSPLVSSLHLGCPSYHAAPRSAIAYGQGLGFRARLQLLFFFTMSVRQPVRKHPPSNPPAPPLPATSRTNPVNPHIKSLPRPGWLDRSETETSVSVLGAHEDARKRPFTASCSPDEPLSVLALKTPPCPRRGAATGLVT